MSKPTASDFINLFEKLLGFFGPSAFDIIDFGLLHSGPRFSILKELFGKNKASLERAKKKRANIAIAERTAKRTHAFRLEDMRPGKVLEAATIYQFFQDAYAPDHDAGSREADKVWIYLSRKFTQALSGTVETAVCGADKDRVFRMIELPELMANSKVKTINSIPWKTVSDLYKSHPVDGPEKAFNLICRSELRLALRRARDEKTSEAIEDYYYRRTYYRLEQRDAMIAKGVTPPLSYGPLTSAERQAELKALKARIMKSSGPARPSRKPAGSPPKPIR